MEPQTVALLIALFMGIYIMFMCRSSFGAMGESIVPNISRGSVMIFFAPWCGHCVRAKPEFEKAVAQGGGDIIMVDATDPVNKGLVKKYNVSGFPTIMKTDGTKYTGDREAYKIVKFKET